MIYWPPNTELSGFIDEFQKLIEVTINGRDIQLPARFLSWLRKSDSWNCQVIRNSSNHTDYSSAILVQQEWHQIPQNAVTIYLPPNKLNSRTIFEGISDHYQFLRASMYKIYRTEDTEKLDPTPRKEVWWYCRHKISLNKSSNLQVANRWSQQ